jgi:hypothetical protein
MGRSKIRFQAVYRNRFNLAADPNTKNFLAGLLHLERAVE